MMLLHTPTGWSSLWVWATSVIALMLLLWAVRSAPKSRLADPQDALPLGIMALSQLALPYLAGGIVEGSAFTHCLPDCLPCCLGFDTHSSLGR